VVATAISAIPELVETEKTGLLVQPGQPEQLAEAMIRLLTDTELRTRVISAASKRVLQDFDNKVLIREIADIYRNEIPAFKNLGI
jgi:glycosyltransferase involved in cell wall biosynthesis